MRLLLILALALGVAWASETLPPPDPAAGAPSASPAAPPAPRVASLLPAGAASPLRLVPNDFEDSSLACTDAEVLRASFPAFALPTGGPRLALLLSAAASDCAGAADGALLGFGGGPGGGPRVELRLDCAARQLVLWNAGQWGSVPPTAPYLRFQLPSADGGAAAAPAAAFSTLLLSLDAGSPSVCVDGQQLLLAADSSADLLQRLAAAGTAAVLGPAVVLGAPSDAYRAARVDLAAAFVADAALPCARTAPADAPALLSELAAAAGSGDAPAALPALSLQVDGRPGGQAAVVGQALRLLATATPLSPESVDAIRLRLTFFGLPPPGCTAAECGDLVLESPAPAAPGQPASLEASAAYPKAGRYIVRVEATAGAGSVATLDHPLLVRKRGDPGDAPCCRHSAGVVAQPLGRPIRGDEYRSPGAAAQAAALGWGGEYWEHEEREAERLFDFGVLAPPAAAHPLRVTACADTRLAGAGSPVLFGTADSTAHHSHGHGKRLALLPAGYDWVTSPDEIDCQEHWSGWQEGSPFRLPNGRGGTCSAACTAEGTRHMLRETGMFEQLNEALIAASYGALSLSPEVAVLPEVLLPREQEGSDEFTFYERAPLQAMRAAGEEPWMWLLLVPLANHKVPPYRAWSGGRSAKGAVITQCFPTFYYAVHETGHRLGFRHANMYRLNSSSTAPTHPLGPGTTTTSGYSDPTDIMACCRGDYGLFYRLMAGWLAGRPGERLTLGRAELAAPARRRLALPESRGNLMALTLRRSEDEVVVIGFRSAPHWQDVGIEGGQAAPGASRHNVRGLSVEIVKRDPATGQWADHRGLADFNVLSGDWPDALPAGPGEDGSFSLLKEGGAWWDPATRLLLSFEAVAGCVGTPGLPLYNHSALNFFGFRGEWPFAEDPRRADFTGFQGLECAQLVLTTDAPEPQGRLEFSVQAAPPGAGPATLPAAGARRRLRMQPAGTASRWVAGDPGSMPAGAPLPSGSPPELPAIAKSDVQQRAACSVPAAPTLQLRLPTGQRLASVVWRDSLNRTLAVQGGSELAAAASDAAPWTTPAVALPPLYPFAEASGDPAAGCSLDAASCQAQQRSYSVLLLAPDGRHARATVTAAPPTLDGQQLEVAYKFYERRQLSYARASLTVPPTWPRQPPASLGGSSSAAVPSGVVVFDAAAADGRPLQLRDSASAVVAGHSLPGSECSRQWSLSLELSMDRAELAGAARDQAGRVLLSIDGGYPAVSLGASQLPDAADQPALWLHWGAARRRLLLARPHGIGGPLSLQLVLVRDGPRLGLWANQRRGGWLVRDLACLPSRPSISYCDHAPDPSAAAFRAPAEVRLGAAAAGAGAGVPAVAASAALAWARYYSYALPEGELGLEATAGAALQAARYRVGAGGGAAGPLLAPAVECNGTAVGDGGGTGGAGGGGLPLPMLAGAAGGGVAVIALAGIAWWQCRRRRRRRQQEQAAAAEGMERVSADSCSAASVSGKSDKLSWEMVPPAA